MRDHVTKIIVMGCLIISMLFFCPVYSADKALSLELQEIEVAEAIQLIAKLLHMNVMVSATVQGVTTLHLQHAELASAFDMLLVAHGLGKWRMGNVWLIAPQNELIRRKETALKWREMSEEALPLVVKTWHLQYAKAQDMATLLSEEHAALLSKRGHFGVDPRTNIIYLADVPTRFANVYRLLSALDVPVQQILINVRLASVDHDFERALGINFNVDTVHNTDNGIDPALNQSMGHYSLAVAKLADGSLLDVKLSALENAGHAELISTPRLFTANQQLAYIESGEEVPYQEVSDSGGTAVVFKKAVLGLKVIPQILPGDKVLLTLQINQDRPGNRAVLGVPTISTRQMMTHVLVKDRQTIVLGGIYEINEENTEQRLPLLNRLPFIGWLFKQQSLHQTKRELLIFVTPKIIAST